MSNNNEDFEYEAEEVESSVVSKKHVENRAKKETKWVELARDNTDPILGLLLLILMSKK